MTTPFGTGDLSAMGLPGGNPLQGAGILETMELVRNAWASFSLPPNMAPTMDPDEIGRRIADLKTVEQWLVMNLTMLRGTIQALEIQQATLAALRAFGAAAEPAAKAEARGAAAEPDAPDTPPSGDALNPVAWWDMLQKQFGEVAAAALAGVPAAIDAATGSTRATAAEAAGSGTGADSDRARTAKAARKTGPAREKGARTGAKAGSAASKRGTRRGSTRG